MITIDDAALKRANELLKECPRQVTRAAHAAVNRTLMHMRKSVSDAVRERYFAKSGDIKKTLAVKRSGGSLVGGALRSTGRPLTLNAFRVTTPKKHPLKISVLKTGAARPMPGFFHNLADGRRRLFMRKGSPIPGRLPITVPHGPSVPQMVGSPTVIQTISRDAGEYLNARFMHEVDYRLSTLGGKS